jgi:hypothetical protein
VRRCERLPKGVEALLLRCAPWEPSAGAAEGREPHGPPAEAGDVAHAARTFEPPPNSNRRRIGGGRRCRVQEAGWAHSVASATAAASCGSTAIRRRPRVPRSRARLGFKLPVPRARPAQPVPSTSIFFGISGIPYGISGSLSVSPSIFEGRVSSGQQAPSAGIYPARC